MLHRNIGILELLKAPSAGFASRAEGWLVRRQHAALMPQVVAVWCRRLGHRVHYATYWGSGDPRRCLPDDLDLVVLSCHTHLAPLAYALARWYGSLGVRTVIGGPHARCYPGDCRRWVDVTVLACDPEIVRLLAADGVPPGSVVTAARQPVELPSLEARLSDVRSSTFPRGAAYPGAFVPMVAGLGCPYGCDFCVDWDTPYHAFPREGLVADVRCAGREMPAAALFFHDPNFGVGIDGHIEALEEARAKNPYLIETSLSVLTEPRLRRLRDTGCRLVAVGIETFSGYEAKAGTVGQQGHDKLEQVLTHLRLVAAYVPYVQATFIVGLDCDSGEEPFELLEGFIRRAPHVWPYINIPFAFGGTPLHTRAVAEGRLLAGMPFSCYKNPYLTLRLAHYEADAYFDGLAALHELLTSPRTLARRWAGAASPAAAFEHALRGVSARPYARTLRAMARDVRGDPGLRAFHEGRSDRLPDVYRAVHARQMGPFVELVRAEDACPGANQDPVEPIVVRGS